MATGKAPKHDFAPAWLKIPDPESAKPSGPKSAEHPSKPGRKNKKDDYYNYNRYGSSEYMYAPLQRQRSFDNYYDERKYSPQKFRHHSVDDDYYNQSYGYNYYNGYYNESYGNHYRSQPSLYREGGSKYTHPNARYQNGPPCSGQVIGDYPPYYEPYMYEYYADPYYPSYMHRAGNNAGCKREGGDRPGKGDKHKAASRKRSSSIEEEFPSLNGDSEKHDGTTKPVTGNGVWGKPSKTVLCPKQQTSVVKGNQDSSNSIEAQDEKVRSNGSTFKTFKVSKPSKDKSKATGSPTPKGPVPLVRNGSKEPFKEDSKHQTTQPMEILNSRLITQPSSKLLDKKSEFLRTLRQEFPSNVSDLNGRMHEGNPQIIDHENHVEPDSCGAIEDNGVKIERLANGVTDLSMDSSHHGILSSSLEAEQRLLREMGWEENNEDDDYVITEDDVREFEKLSNQMKEQRNGFKKTLPISWSPQHLPQFKNPSERDAANDALSSTSDDSDADLK